MKNKKVWIILLSVLFVLCIGGLGYWYLEIYRYEKALEEYAYLEKFEINTENKKTKLYQVKGAIYNLQESDGTIMFDFNAWDIEDQESLYWEKTSLPYQKYKGDVSSLHQDILAVELNISLDLTGSLFQALECSLVEWDLKEIQLEKDQLSKSLEVLYDYLLPVRDTDLSSPFENDDFLFVDLLLSYFDDENYEYSKRSEIIPVRYDKNDTSTIIPNSPDNSLEKILYLDPKRCNILLETKQNYPSYFSSIEALCNESSIVNLAETKIAASSEKKFTTEDLLTLISIENISRETIEQDLIKEQAINLIDLVKDIRALEISKDELDHKLLETISDNIIKSELFDFMTYCQISTVLEARHKTTFESNSNILLNEQNINVFNRITDSYPKDSLFCTETFKNSSNKNLINWSYANIYKSYYLYFLNHEEQYVSEDINKSYLLIKLLSNIYEN